MRAETKGFNAYLIETKQTPSTIYWHYPIDNPGQFHRNLADAHTVEVFCNQYLRSIKKNILVSAWALSMGSLAWQAAAELNDRHDLLVFSLKTGFWAAVGLNLAYCICLERSATAYVVSISSKLLPVWLADSLWQLISISTKNAGKHLVYFMGEGSLYAVAQLIMSRSVKRILNCCQVEEKVKSHVPQVNWSTPMLLGVCYFGFQYLTEPLGFLTVLPAAAVSVAIPAILWGAVDYALARRNAAALKKLAEQYALSDTAWEYEHLNDPSATNPVETQTFCQIFTDCLTAPFRYCYSFFQSCYGYRNSLTPVHSSINDATIPTYEYS